MVKDETIEHKIHISDLYGFFSETILAADSRVPKKLIMRVWPVDVRIIYTVYRKNVSQTFKDFNEAVTKYNND